MRSIGKYEELKELPKYLWFSFSGMDPPNPDHPKSQGGTSKTEGPTVGAEGHQYTYEEYEGAGGTEGGALPRRPLPEIPSAPPGQSSRALVTTDDGNGEDVANNMRDLNINRDKGVESFILRQLPVFAGDYNGDLVREWTGKVQLLKKIMKVPDTELLRLLPLRMSFRAADFFQGYVAKLEPREATWEKVKKALVTRYGGAADAAKLVNQLHSARMGRDVPVREYAHEVERLARLAYPELVEENDRPQNSVQKSLLNRISLEQFVSGLPPTLSRALVEKKIDDFQDAVQMAAHLEEVNTRFLKKATVHALHTTDAERSDRPAAATDEYPPQTDMAPKPKAPPHKDGFHSLGEDHQGYYAGGRGGNRFGYRGGHHNGYRGHPVMQGGFRGGNRAGYRGGTYPGFRNSNFSNFREMRVENSSGYRGGHNMGYRGGYQAQSRGNRTFGPRRNFSGYQSENPPHLQGRYYPETFGPSTRGRGYHSNEVRQGDRFYQNQGARDTACYRCGNQGHFSRECPRCQICSEYGHHSSHCQTIMCISCHSPGHRTNECQSKNAYGRPWGRHTN